MIRPPSKRFLLRELLSDATARMSAWRRNDGAAVALQQEFVPRFRRLEPRFVLNATAELNPIGQLLVMGTDDPETVQMQIDGNGDLQLFDENNAIIPIDGHPDGPGNESNPLDPSAITDGLILIDIGGGDDSLDLQLPSGLDVTVVDSGGYDTTVLRFSDDQSPGTIDIDSDQIEISSASAVIAINDANLILTGDVMLGSDGQSTELALGTGSLDVTGRLIVSGDALVSGTGARVDLSAASVSADSMQATLTFDLVNQPGLELSFGGADDSAGSFIEALDVRSASSVSFLSSPFQVAGDVSVEDAEAISIDADIDTTSGSQDGDLLLQATTSTSITSNALINVGDATITIDGGDGPIDLLDGRLQSNNVGDAITIINAGDVMLGDVTAASGALTLGEIGAEVADITQAPDTALIVDRLSIDSTGSVDLSNPQNQIRVIERLDVDGNVSITDSLSNLAVIDIDSRGQNVTLKSSGAILIARIEAISADVRLTAASVNDTFDDGLADITASRVFIDAESGIGNLRPLELMSVTELTATSDTGDITLNSLGPGPLELRSVIAGDGAITISSLGTMIATEVTSQNASGLDDGSRDIRLTALGNADDILVTSITADGNADVWLAAGDDILDSDVGDMNLIAADDLRLIADNGMADTNVAISLTTWINDLDAAVTGENRGDLLLVEQDSIVLASSDQQGDEIIETSNGQIVISAGGDITIVDTSLGDDGADLTQDPEIVARGDRGRIDLETPGTIELLDDVQLHSEQVTTRYPNPETVSNPVESELQREDRSVFLKSDTVLFGERIEINTGVDQGIARIFAPRPIVVIDRSDPDNPKPAPPADPNSIPAFFEPFTVATSVLEQAAVNDAAGILTIDIGRTGERGLTVDIDWGAPTSNDGVIGQFQQLNGLSADASIQVGIDADGRPLDPVVGQESGGVLQVEHLYKQSAILESRENGRASATDPLEIRFAVRQHDSIFVQANIVAQAPDFEAIPVEGRVVSSTDNPLTPADTPNGLENGQASFIIPSLTIPLEFIPVREVIPELETQEIIVRVETVTPFVLGSIQTEESTASSSVGREEYFQIRILSPDPEGDFLAEPERLPDDILDADKFTKLFENLPDGQYEIDYVLGDGNERSILRVDVENGQATIPHEPLDAEGRLLLEELFEDSLGEESADSGEPEARDGEAEEIRDGDPSDGDDQRLTDPDGDDSAMIELNPAGTTVAGAMIATTMERRYRRRNKRLSAAGRFAARRRRMLVAEKTI